MEEKDSWSGRDERVQEATEEGEIEWRFRRNTGSGKTLTHTSALSVSQSLEGQDGAQSTSCDALSYNIKFLEDMSTVGLRAYREKVQQLMQWCRAKNLSLNINKTEEMDVDFRRAQSYHSLQNIDGSSMEIIKSNKFLVENLTWSLNSSSISKKAQQKAPKKYEG
ncbi:hypothetical protein QTP70_019987 [Hemibagrus guttatus]|uniref:Uncharacterized protein n=1 Tax=Hemibagrus guttatus TaxID=175788 RepID=A0AAE0R8J2_9TELE|nr:hypothetical protein QTP70_019987 [Hemibagrus guttatus]